ncbi:hypothetical protein AB7M49_004265 [Bradyrhizobium elkanii]
MQVQVSAEQGTALATRDKAQLQLQRIQTPDRVLWYGSASLSCAFNFFDSDGQGISLRIGAATHYSFPARLAAPSLGLACQRRKGNVMTKKIAEIKTTIRTTTPYTGTL